MRKKVIYCIIAFVLLLVLAGIGTWIGLSFSFDIRTDKNGNVVLTASSVDRVAEVLQENSADSLVINLSVFTAQKEVDLNDSKGRSKLTINGGAATYKNISFTTNAKEVFFSNITILNSVDSCVLELTGSNPHVTFDDVTIKSNYNSGTAVKITSNNAEMTIERSVLLQGGDGAEYQDGGVPLKAQNLTITGNGSFKCQGGAAGKGLDGKKGSDGTSYSTSRKTAAAFDPGHDGANGGSGQHGQDGRSAGHGGDAIVANNVTIEGSLTVLCYGGAANKSGNGGSGGHGGNGEGATKAKLAQFASYQGGRGGDAGNGGSGADEERPGCGINANQLTIASSAKVTCKAGAKGSAGKGAAAGSPGKGGESSGGSVGHPGGYGTASGGNQGQPGKDGKSLDVSKIQDYIVQRLVGTIK